MMGINANFGGPMDNKSLYKFKEFCKNKFPYHNIRPQQIKMMDGIFNSISQEKNLIIEAPTGVGKTLSYLIPAMYFAERKNKRIIILTETIDQQERIFEELSSLKHNLKVSFIIGKNNFFCKSKGSKADGLFCKLNKKCQYRPNKKSKCICGTKKEIIKVGENIRYYCPFCVCDYQKSKIKCLDADIVVMNNSIFYHIKEEIDVNRKTQIIICDEAHKLEGSIRNSTTIVMNPDVALNRLRTMAYYYAPKTIKKYLIRLSDKYNLNNKHEFDNEHKNEPIEKSMDRDMDHYQREFWDIIYNYVSKYANIEDCKNALVHDGDKITSWDLKEEVAILGTLLEGYYQIYNIKKEIMSFKENEELNIKDLNFKIEGKALISLEFQFIFNKKLWNMPLMEFLDNIYSLKTISNNFVIYRKENSLLCEPVLISSYLKKLYNGATVIHCSATLGNLKVHGLKTGMGTFNTLVLDSPFPKDRKKIIALSDGENMKHDNNKKLKRKRANENIYQLLKSAKCNSLVLFKSFEDLNSAYNYLKDRGKELNKRIFCYEQDMDGKEAKKLKELFEKEGGILLATGRFAEGVDIPGEALTMVIIDSLPFPVPTPLLNREQKLIEEGFIKKGIDPKTAHWNAFLMTSFHIMSRTVIQMIGRLIRTEEDYGIVVIQDRRFYEWVGPEMKKRGYLKDNYESMELKNTVEYVSEFLNRFKKE